MRPAATLRASSKTPAVSRVSAEAKLAIAEFLLSCSDPDECAHHAVEWLQKYCRIDRAVCALLDSESKHLVGVAGVGVPVGRVRNFGLDLEDREQPFVGAFLDGKVLALPAANGRKPASAESMPFDGQ